MSILKKVYILASLGFISMGTMIIGDVIDRVEIQAEVRQAELDRLFPEHANP